MKAFLNYYRVLVLTLILILYMFLLSAVHAGKYKSVAEYENEIEELATGWAIDEALAMANEAVESYPDKPEGYRARALCLAELKKFDQSMNDIDKAIKMNPKDGNSYLMRSMIYQYQDANDKALADLATAIELEPNNYDFRSRRGYLLSGLKKYNEAIIDFNYANKLAPQKKHFIRGRAMAYEGKREFLKAAEDYGRAIALSNNPEDRMKRASCFMRAGKFEKACDDFDIVIKGNPKDDEALVRRAEAFYRLKKYSEALLDLNEVIRLDKDSGLAYFIRGWVYKALGDEDKFKNDIRKAARLNWTVVNDLNKRLRYEIP